jgi:puromycin-sensitive aminopeptidase
MAAASTQGPSPFFKPEVIGLGATMEPDHAGTLYLRINDFAGELADNTSADWQITRPASGRMLLMTGAAFTAAGQLHLMYTTVNGEAHKIVEGNVNKSLGADFQIDLVGQFGEEKEQAIWSVINGGLAGIDHHAVADDTRPAFQRFVRDLVGPALKRLGWDPAPDESDLTRKLRGDLIAAMGNIGNDEDTISRSRAIVADLLGGASMDPEVVTAALSVYARHGGEAEYDLLWETYLAATEPLDQVRYLRSVAAVPTKDQVVTTVDRIVNGDIRTQDGFWVLARLLVGKGGQSAWESARTRWSEVLARMPGLNKRRITEGLSGLSQPEVAADVKAFFAETPLPEAATSLAQNLELLDANVLLRARETPVVSKYFGLKT